jgi:hypothetical protein
MIGVLAAHVALGHPVQFGVDKGDQLIESLVLSLAPEDQQLRDLL